MAIASPVLFWTERATAKAVNTMALQQLAGALEQHSELGLRMRRADVLDDPLAPGDALGDLHRRRPETVRTRLMNAMQATLEHLHKCVNRHPSEHIAAGQKAVSSRVATA